MLGPTDQKRLGHVNQLETEEFPKPAEPLNRTLGKYAALATPIWALAWATARSAAAMSGRRSSSSEGIPTGVAGGLVSRACAGRANVDAGWPIKTAMACSGGRSARPLKPTISR